MKKIFYLLITFSPCAWSNSSLHWHNIGFKYSVCLKRAPQGDIKAAVDCVVIAKDEFQSRINDFNDFLNRTGGDFSLKIHNEYQETWKSYIDYKVSTFVTSEVGKEMKYPLEQGYRLELISNHYYELYHHFCTENIDQLHTEKCMELSKEIK